MESPQNTEQQPILPEEKQQRLDEKQQNEQEFKAGQASRRSRKDIEGRDFVCGCGKKYLSYPALYTHIKTKHDGRQPEGTMKYSTSAPAKKTKTKLEQQHLNYLISLVRREDIKLLDLFSIKLSGSTPVSARLKSKILQKNITDAYHSLLKSTTSPLKITKQSSLQQHLVAWLIGVGEFLTEKLHDQYQWFARTVRECYYQMGNEVYNKCFSKKQGGLCYVPTFKVQKVKYFPLICDFYIRFFLPYEYSELNANLMELILTDFCNWLNSRKCTFIGITLNKEYKLNDSQKIEQQLKTDKQKKSLEEQDKSHRSQVEDESQLRENKLFASQKQPQNYDDLAEPIQKGEIKNPQKEQIIMKIKQNQQQNDDFITPGNEQNIMKIQQALKFSETQNLANENEEHKPLKVNHNWSLVPQPAASQSSQQIPQYQQEPVHEQKVESEVAKLELQILQNKDDAKSQKM